MSKARSFFLALTIFTTVMAYGSATRVSDVDTWNSSDKTKTWTPPAATDTLVGRASTDTLTNKSISGATNTVSALASSVITSGSFSVARGGTGLATLTANSVLVGNGTSAVTFVAPGASGNVLKSNGTSWTSGTVSGAGTVTSVDMSVPAFLSVSGNPITSSGTLAVTLSGTALPIANGGTNSTTALSGNRAIVSNASSLVESSTTSTEIGFLSGVTSSIQSQINGLANTSLSNLGTTAINTSLLFGAGVSGTISTAQQATATPLLTLRTGNPTVSGIVSGDVNIFSGFVTGGAASGAVIVNTGQSSAASTGQINITTGDAGTSSGGLTLGTGQSAGSSNSGAVIIQTGFPSGTGNSGNITLTSGSSTVTTGGVNVQSGNGLSTNGASGNAKLFSGTGIGTGTSGDADVFTGDTVNTSSGQLNLYTGAPSTSGNNSGTANLSTGATTGAASGAVNIFSGNATTAASGTTSIKTGTATTTSGQIAISSGAGVTNGSTGSSIMQSGAPAGTGASGLVEIVSGNTPGAGNSGNAIVKTGNSTSGNSGDVQLTTGTAASGTRGEVISNGHFGTTGTLPTMGACGTSPTVAGNDNAGKITVGTGGTATSCTMTFAQPFVGTAVCFANDASAIIAIQVVTSGATMTITSAAPFAASSTLYYFCTDFR